MIDDLFKLTLDPSFQPD
jgi:hypothetical protein